MKHKSIELKRKIDKSIIIAGGFRTPAIPSNQKICRSKKYNQQNPSDIYGKIHLKTVKYTFFKYSCYIQDIPYILESILKI